jgi:hypothetical protein
VYCCSLSSLNLESVQANEDPSSFQNSCTGLPEGLAALKVTATVRFLLVRVKEVAVLRVVFLVVLPTIK